MNWDSLSWFEQAIAIILIIWLLEILFGVLETLFDILCDFCDAVNHRIKYGAGVVLQEDKENE
jgi:hypothetical protein